MKLNISVVMARIGVLMISMLPLTRAIGDPIPTGFGRMEISRGAQTITVFTYKSENYHGGPLLVVCHGMLRNADLYCTNAVTLARRFNMLIAAPMFDTNQFPGDGYHMGGVMKRGVAQPPENWTYQFIPEVINAVRKREAKTNLPYYLIGHSAGGQFVERYAALMPSGAERIVAVNPGSDLFPRRDWKFGYGFGGLPSGLSDDAALQHYLAAPLTLYLGLADTDPQHPELDRSAAAELQGRYRLERGRECFAYAQNLAQEHGWKFSWVKVEVPGIAHDAQEMFAAKQVKKALFVPEGGVAQNSP
jgi:pimeloyl-ACP methyl ester carboxylesterase